VSGDTTQYVLDLAATLPVVVSDTKAVYLYGLDIIAQQQSERLYYFHDGLGSVRQLVDATGEVEASYAYDPFGVPVMGGEVANPYQFTGEAWDAEVELLYLRARYYQPETGRFITKDPWAGDLWQPNTLNRYVYVTNNPVNLVDQRGMDGRDPWARACMLEDTCEGLEHLGAKLEMLYGILVGGRQRHHPRTGAGGPMEEYTLWSDWTWSQLDLLLEAAGDMSDLMQGGRAGFKERIAPVRVYKREGELVVFGDAVRGWTSNFSITFSGFWWDDVTGQKWTVVHELAHWWDFRNGALLSGGMLTRGMWSREPVECQLPRAETEKATLEVRRWKRGRSKARLNPREDWAESVAAYVYEDYAGGVGKEISRDRWDYVGEYMNPLDRKPYPWSESMFEG